MKRIITAALAATLTIALLTFYNARTEIPAGADGPSYGVVRFDFDDYSDLTELSLFSSFGRGYSLMNGKLYTERSGEQKAVFKTETLTDFEMSAELFTPSDGAYIDGGFYFGINGDIGNNVDAINAYQICFLRSGGHNVLNGDYTDCTIRIYKFSYVNGVTNYTYLTEAPAYADMHPTMKLKIEDKTAYVYLDGNKNPTITYVLDDYVGGRVGLRTFYCSMGFDDIEIYAESLPTDTASLSALCEKAAGLDENYTYESESALSSALIKAQEALSAKDQRMIDAAEKSLSKAIGGLIIKRSSIELDELISRASAVNESGYTANTYRSLVNAAKLAKACDKTDENAVSKAYALLNECIEDLTPKFIKGGSDQ